MQKRVSKRGRTRNKRHHRPRPMIYPYVARDLAREPLTILKQVLFSTNKAGTAIIPQDQYIAINCNMSYIKPATNLGSTSASRESMRAIRSAVAKFLAKVLPLDTCAIGVFHRTRGSRVIARCVIVHVVIGPFLRTKHGVGYCK